ncbi:S9 family serine peptidase [Ligilactobacillus equi DSM 15833 = JCM 10991]|uniref:S9 family serine peptidase n=2 Tax=Ligilactobacillus equi TaxID=137357 RepID=A0A0R1T2S9_9LACO|nr:S9 family serine peptidase [Ligilactobacillus equi DSM 15833 = JCM 10991]
MGDKMITIQTKEIMGLPFLEVVKPELKQTAAPLVVFYHGWTGCKEEVLGQALEIAKHNIRVLLPDALYHGDRQDGQVESHQLEFWQIVVNSVKEFPQLVQAYQEADLVTPKQIGVAGMSMGGITTNAIFTLYPWVDAAVCLEGTPQLMKFAHYLIENLPGDLNLDPAYIEEQISRLAVLDLSQQAKKIAGRPLHFWHGTADSTIPFEVTWDFYQDVKAFSYGRNVTFTAKQGGVHKIKHETMVEMGQKFAEYFGK